MKKCDVCKSFKVVRVRRGVRLCADCRSNHAIMDCLYLHQNISTKSGIVQVPYCKSSIIFIMREVLKNG